MTARKIRVILYSKLQRVPAPTDVPALADFKMEYEKMPTSKSETWLNRRRHLWRKSQETVTGNQVILPKAEKPAKGSRVKPGPET